MKKKRLLLILAIIIIAVIYISNSKKDSTKVGRTQSTIKTETSTKKGDTSIKKEEKETFKDTDEIVLATVEDTSSSTIQVIKQTSAVNDNNLSNLSSNNFEQEKAAANNEIEDLYQPVSQSFYDASDLKGRGLVDYPGTEPNYVNATGYAVVHTEANLENNPSFSNTPWVVPIYKNTESGWEMCGTIGHKTRIGILGQVIRKQNGREYEGYLEFQELSSGAVAYINVKNFVTVPYWDLDISKSVDKGYGVATFKQISEYAPIYKDGKKAVVKNYAQVLLPARGTYYVSTLNRVDYQIVGVVFESNNNKTEPQYVFFNKKDLTISY